MAVTCLRASPRSWDRPVSNTNRKQVVHQLDPLPDDVTYDDMMRELYERQAIERGIVDSDAGRGDDVKTVRAKYGLAKWRVVTDARRLGRRRLPVAIFRSRGGFGRPVGFYEKWRRNRLNFAGAVTAPVSRAATCCRIFYCGILRR